MCRVFYTLKCGMFHQNAYLSVAWCVFRIPCVVVCRQFRNVVILVNEYTNSILPDWQRGASSYSPCFLKNLYWKFGFSSEPLYLCRPKDDNNVNKGCYVSASSRCATGINLTEAVGECAHPQIFCVRTSGLPLFPGVADFFVLVHSITGSQRSSLAVVQKQYSINNNI